MSWLSENYEKAALGGAVIIALAVGAAIFSGGDDKEVTANNPSQKSTIELPQEKLLAELNAKADQKLAWHQVDHLGVPLNSFVGVPVFSIKGQEMVKEIDADTQFDGIPLKWWRKYGLEDYKYADAGARDADGEGFTNQEEYAAQTDPTDPKSHPDFINKLKFVDSNVSKFRLQWTVFDADRGSFTFKLLGRANRNLPSSVDVAKVGDFFPKESKRKEYIKRFKVVKKGKGMNPKLNIEDEYFDVLDTKKGLTYRLWYSGGAVAFSDWNATFKLNNDPAFTVEEGAEFSLPFEKGKKGYKFLLKPHDPKLRKLPKVEIQFKNAGKSETRTLHLVAPTN